MTALDPYKGVRDFYPEDERIQKYIFDAMRRAVESYGYEEMNASILEPTDLYAAKTSEEIVSKQTYTFTDRGDRSVTLRPEMTPTVARMVAARKRELGFPLRWYSIQNFFRYERPQRGRLREFWQLNADLFGDLSPESDTEMIALAYRVMKELGAKDEDFIIRIGSREFLDSIYNSVRIPASERQEMTRLIDKGAELPKNLSDALSESEPMGPLAALETNLRALGINNYEFNWKIARGFDYYTGIVFEVFDTHEDNSRSMFGGGRYDNLVGQYGKEDVPAIGFAMGDVIARDFLETHKLLPDLSSSAHLYLAPVTKLDYVSASLCADTLRAKGVHVALGLKQEKMGDHIKAALKLGIPYFAAYGEKEKESGMLTVKALQTEKEETLALEKVPEYIKKL